MKTDSPVFLLHALPLGRVVIRDFFNPSGQLFQELLNPPRTRQHGFGLRMLGIPRHYGEYWETSTDNDSKSGLRKLRVYSNGQIIFRAPGDASFLCWPSDLNKRVANPVVIAESILSFCRFTKRIFDMMSEQPDEVALGVEIRNAGNSTDPIGMYRGRLRAKMELACISGDSLSYTSESDPKQTIRVPVVELCQSSPDNEFAGADQKAYMIAIALYSMFALDSSAFPYSSGCEGAQLVDIGTF
jgi:hypothetical protein